MGLPLIVSGLIVKSQKKHFRSIRNNFIPQFHNTLDNYAQFAPMAVTYGLKLANVEGRSSWKRLITSNAFSAALMASMVSVSKSTTKEMRPDGTSANSFPSGHTATAFMFATILHKEYGLTRSPLFSIAGYSLATTTGIMRILNNRHWVSDVLVGAGIGVISTDLGYLFADLLFKNKGITRKERNDITGDLRKNPSFLGINMGTGITENTVKLPELKDGNMIHDIHLGNTTSVGLEGAYFINPYIGLGARINIITLPIKVYKDSYELGNPTVTETNDIVSENMGMVNIDEGLYFSLPLSARFALGTKYLIGRRIMGDISLEKINYNKDGNEAGRSKYIDIKSKNSFKWGSGVSCTYAYKQNMNLKLFVDYDFSNVRYNFVIHSKDNQGNEIETPSESTQKDYRVITFGASMNISF